MGRRWAGTFSFGETAIQKALWRGSAKPKDRRPLAWAPVLRYPKLKQSFYATYPEGNFGGNQLLDGSISLSPLYPGRTIDLHVRTAAVLHQSFLWLRPARA